MFEGPLLQTPLKILWLMYLLALLPELLAKGDGDHHSIELTEELTVIMMAKLSLITCMKNEWWWVSQSKNSCKVDLWSKFISCHKLLLPSYFFFCSAVWNSTTNPLTVSPVSKEILYLLPGLLREGVDVRKLGVEDFAAHEDDLWSVADEERDDKTTEMSGKDPWIRGLL